MTMPKFEPVASRMKVLARANELAANSNFHITGFDGHKTGNVIQAIFEEFNSQLTEELEAARADAKEAWGKLAEQCIAHAATIHKLAAEQAKSMQLREALESCGYADDSTDPEMCGPYYDAELVQQALAIQPDDAALKAWLGEPVAEVDDSGVVIVCRYDYKPKDKFYSPKGLK